MRTLDAARDRKLAHRWHEANRTIPTHLLETIHVRSHQRTTTPHPQLIAGRYRCIADTSGTVRWTDEHDTGRELTLLDVLADARVAPNAAITVHLAGLRARLPRLAKWATTMEDHARALLAGNTPASGLEWPADKLLPAISRRLTELYRACEELGELTLATLHPGPDGGCFAPEGAWQECTCPFALHLVASDLDPAVGKEMTVQLSHALTVKQHMGDAAFWMGQAAPR